MMGKKKQPALTFQQTARAIYLDFEGFTDQPPTLCGVMVDGEFSQVVFDERLEPAVRHAQDVKGRPIQMADRDLFLRSLVERVVAEDRRLIAFSRHELEVLDKIEGIGDQITDRYFNALPLIKQWRERVHPNKAKEAQKYRAWYKARKATNKKACEDSHKSVGNRLVDYLPLIGIKVSTAHAPGKQTSRITAILSGLKRTKGDYAGLTPTQKGKWTKLLKHNELDVAGLEQLIRVVGQ